jgi:hypothetical protein
MDGVNSIAMIKLLIQQPYNINQLADVIKTDNKAEYDIASYIRKEQFTLF